MSDDTLWRQVFEAANEALELSPAEQPAFLERYRSAHPGLAVELMAVLEGAAAAPALETPAIVFAAPFLNADALAEQVDPAVIPALGAYRVLSVLGRGGMGTVYLGERADDQYTKRVALKVFPHWDLSDQRRVQRFVEERQILASLDHPGIARLLDGGLTSDGLPWFAMEYIDGVPIDRHCDDGRLSIEARLELFCRVCSAVQYAHRNLVVHRDLKPSNILIAADGRVALLDFGIAKLLSGPDMSPKASLTITGDRLLTPLYASPEQIRGESVSTATDVYALGVLLHVLLTGGYPYHLTSMDSYAVARAVMEHEPERPSVTVTRSARSGTEPSSARAALMRGITPSKLLRRLRGDLDAIVLRAMEKDPRRRYATAEQLEADVRRYLTGLPIIAQPESRLYHARKFVSRHRAGVGTAAAVAALVLAFTVVTTVQRERIRTQAERLTLERDRSSAAQRILRRAVQGATVNAPDRVVSAQEVLDSAAVEIDKPTATDTAERAQVMFELALAYHRLNLEEKARQLVEHAIGFQRRHAPKGDLDVAQSVDLLGAILQTQNELRPADRAYSEALTLRRRALGPQHRDIARTLVGLSTVRRKQGRLAESEALAREALGIDETRGGDTSADIAQSTSALGHALLAKADSIGAQRSFRRALALLRQAPNEESVDVVNALLDLAASLSGAGRHAESDSLTRQAVQISQRLVAAAAFNGSAEAVRPAVARPPAEFTAVVRGALGGSVGPAAIPGRVASDSSRIVFTSDRDGPDPVGDFGNHEIYVMDVDGSGQHRLTREAAWDYDPDWSPDGTRIVFASGRHGASEIFLMNADGSGQRRLTNFGDSIGAHQPAWSPTGELIAFRSRVRSSLYVMKTDGSGLTRIAVGAAQPAWSPDGKRIAFESQRDGNREIYLMDPDGGNVVRLTFNPAADQWPEWSPDGRRFAFHSKRDGDMEIYVMDADGTNAVRLTSTPGDDVHPTWSPDGRRIAFHRRPLGHGQIYVMNADGSNQKRLTELSAVAFNAFPRWGPARR